jgi:hypothetical protein
MMLSSSDRKRFVDLGTSDILFSVYSTAATLLQDYSEDISLGLRFLEKGVCESKEGYRTARQINLIRDGLARFSPDQAVYDRNDPQKTAPWKSLSPVITSCANLFTTADGKDLLYELVSILCYAEICEVSVSVS